ncbi:hypothetical protein BC835DRAFT_1554530 [Cytidiella melzeri]|nr:hypothetical protein BC835DRAFT_1554530 [Cytidiella melzeri]
MFAGAPVGTMVSLLALARTACTYSAAVNVFRVCSRQLEAVCGTRMFCQGLRCTAMAASKRANVTETVLLLP